MSFTIKLSGLKDVGNMCKPCFSAVLTSKQRETTL